MAIERLTSAMRNAVKLSRSDARMMHVLDDAPVMGLTRYNIRTPKNEILKLTVGENVLCANYLKKNTQGGYLSNMLYILKSSSESINEKFAEIVNNVIKK